MTDRSQHPPERSPLGSAPERPLKPFRPRATLAVAALVLGGWVMHASAIADDPRRTFSFAVLVCAVATLPPVLMAIGILVMTSVAAVLLAPIHALAQLQRRPSGLGTALRDLARPGLAFVPGYVAAWRRAASPWAIGGLVGSVTAAVVLVTIGRPEV